MSRLEEAYSDYIPKLKVGMRIHHPDYPFLTFRIFDITFGDEYFQHRRIYFYAREGTALTYGTYCDILDLSYVEIADPNVILKDILCSK